MSPSLTASTLRWSVKSLICVSWTGDRSANGMVFEAVTAGIALCLPVSIVPLFLRMRGGDMDRHCPKESEAISMLLSSFLLFEDRFSIPSSGAVSESEADIV